MFDRVPTLMERLFLGRSIPRRTALARRAPRWLVERIQSAEFQQTLRRVGTSSRFYRERFTALDIHPERVRRPADLGDFFTTSADLRSRDTADFLCAPPQAGFETTGTTAKNKRIYFSNEEVHDIGFEGAVGLWNLGLRPGDRVVDAFDYAFWNAGITLMHSLNAVGCFHMIGSKLEPAEFYRRVRDYEFNVLVVDTAWLVSLTELAERCGVWPVKFILSGSENMSEATRAWVERVWNTKVYQAYGQTESLGASGIECPAQKGYHLNEMNFMFEIVNPNPEGYGELVFTTLTRKIMPLVRYRSNDITRFLDEPCGCALQSMRRIDKIQGRGDEIVSCGMGMISPWIFEAWLSPVAALADEWQVAVTQPGPRDVIEVRVESREELATPALRDLEAELLARYEQLYPYYFKNMNMGMYDLRLRFLPRGTLRGIHAGGTRRKLRRVVDERIAAAARPLEAALPR
ncbi:MAG TPA: AMP-binding protein [Terriglobales bacterium]|nr:AMP-binding protein [Terriglobales bacterium]